LKTTSKTKVQLKADIAEFVRNSPTNQPIKNSELMEVLSGHYDWDSKVGCGISHLEVREARYSTKCIWIVRVDGTETDISWHKALKGIKGKMTLHQKMIKAARDEVADQILSFAKPVKGLHIDHVAPITFKFLFTEFFKDSIHATEEHVPQFLRFVDREVAKVWSKYHAENCVLEQVTARENLSERYVKQ